MKLKFLLGAIFATVFGLNANENLPEFSYIKMESLSSRINSVGIGYREQYIDFNFSIDYFIKEPEMFKFIPLSVNLNYVYYLNSKQYLSLGPQFKVFFSKNEFTPYNISPTISVGTFCEFGNMPMFIELKSAFLRYLSILPNKSGFFYSDEIKLNHLKDNLLSFVMGVRF